MKTNKCVWVALVLSLITSFEAVAEQLKIPIEAEATNPKESILMSGHISKLGQSFDSGVIENSRRQKKGQGLLRVYSPAEAQIQATKIATDLARQNAQTLCESKIPGGTLIDVESRRKDECSGDVENLNYMVCTVKVQANCVAPTSARPDAPHAETLKRAKKPTLK